MKKKKVPNVCVLVGETRKKKENIKRKKWGRNPEKKGKKRDRFLLGYNS